VGRRYSPEVPNFYEQRAGYSGTNRLLLPDNISEVENLDLNPICEHATSVRPRKWSTLSQIPFFFKNPVAGATSSNDAQNRSGGIRVSLYAMESSVKGLCQRPWKSWSTKKKLMRRGGRIMIEVMRARLHNPAVCCHWYDWTEAKNLSRYLRF